MQRAQLSEGAGVDTPGVKHDPDPDAPEMQTEEATRHRSLVALANFIAQDRADGAFATKELSQTMARPRAGDEVGVKRLARYLRQYPEASILYGWQPDPQKVDGFSDSDWGGCVRTRRSTSGGVLMYGSHCLGFWSRTQQTVSLSSCEAEVNALVKLGVEGLSLRNLVRHCGYPDAELRLHTDASAAIGVCRRYGSGKVKHLSFKQLWAQEKVDRGDFDIIKVSREVNMSDLLTHHATKAEIERFLGAMRIRRGRHGRATRRGGVSNYRLPNL